MKAAHRYHAEFRTLLTLALPIIMAQLAQHGIGFVDTIMAGRAGAEELAAVALGSSLWIPLFLALEGLLMATTPLVAHEVGADRPQSAAGVFSTAIWVAIGCGLLAAICLNNTSSIFIMMGVGESLRLKTEAYLTAISWGFPAFMLYQVIRSFSEGFGRTSPVMKIAVFALLCNIPLNYLLVFGKLGFPAMGAEGCGWASALVMWITLAMGILYLNRSNSFRACKIRDNLKRPNFLATGRFLRLGIPIGIALLIEASMFAFIALLLADQGENAIAAHQVTLSFSGMTFMIPLSISMAITIRVGQQLGAGNRAGAKTSAYTGMVMTLACALASSSLMFLLGKQIAGIYTDIESIVLVAAELIAIAAIFQFSDAIQVASAGALRGYKDTSVPLLFVFIAYWMIGLPVGYVLAKTDIIIEPIGPHGFWIGLVIGLTVGAILLLSRLTGKTRVDRCAEPV